MPVGNQVNVPQYNSLQPVQGPWPKPHHNEVRPEEFNVIPVERSVERDEVDDIANTNSLKLSFPNPKKPHQILRGVLKTSDSSAQQPDVFSSDARNFEGNNTMAPVRGLHPLGNMSNMVPAAVNDQQQSTYKSHTSMASPTFQARVPLQMGPSKSAYVKKTLDAAANSRQPYPSRRPVAMNGGYPNSSSRVETAYSGFPNMGRSYGSNTFTKPALPIQPRHDLLIPGKYGYTHKGNLYDPVNGPDPEF